MDVQVLINRIKDLLEEELEVKSEIVQKGNEKLVGICIGSGKAIPIIYLKNYEDLFEECGYGVVARQIISDYKEIKNITINEDICDFEKYVRDNLILCIAPYGTNDGYVTIPYLDLELYFRVDLRKTNLEASYKVKEDMLDKWNTSKRMLLDIALMNGDYFAESMIETMIKMGADIPDEVIEDIRSGHAQDQIILSNEDKYYGAASIYNKTLLKEVADKYEDDLYIIPSSIHEVLLMKVNSIDKEILDEMVKQINIIEVNPTEVLSDHVYIFRRDTMEIEW